MFYLIILLTFICMEGVTWLTHKYVMHGFLWTLHRDHHQKEEGFFERNDAFFLIFAIPGSSLIFFGVSGVGQFSLPIGIGITLYGMAYLLVHDIFIHQRFRLFRNTKNKYLLALRRGHKMHHKHLNKEEGECFGMLLVPFRYFRDAKKGESLLS